MNNQVTNFDEAVSAVWQRSKAIFGTVFDPDHMVEQRMERIKTHIQNVETADHSANVDIVMDIAEHIVFSIGQNKEFCEQAIASLDRRYHGEVRRAISGLRVETEGHVIALVM